MQALKKSVITIVGGFLLFIGIIFIILPGPAILFIPLGLGLLALEYPSARKALRKFQRVSSKWAGKADSWLAKRRK